VARAPLRKLQLMTAILLFVLLAAGGAGYVSWARHAIAQGDPAWWFVVGAPFAYFTPVLILVALWFALSWIWRTPRPPEARLGLAAIARLFTGEVLAVAASWPLIAFHRFLIRDPVAGPVTRPVILVHGVLVNDGVWFMMRRRLARHGVRGIYTHNYGPPHEGIEHFARQLAEKIEQVRRATGAERVTLVCHSMGGLVARAYVRDFGAAHVERIVTIGTPHHGSVLAWMYFGRCLAQMRPGNAWLDELNRDDRSSQPAPIVSVWSRHDSMVAPQASSELEGAENVRLVGIGHNALLGDRDVIYHTLDAITGGLVAGSVDLGR
jgi:triacylglycerol esterase/lipase EstA (alpha/beta hydrolase family)